MWFFVKIVHSFNRSPPCKNGFASELLFPKDLFFVNFALLIHDDEQVYKTKLPIGTLLHNYFCVLTMHVYVIS